MIYNEPNPELELPDLPERFSRPQSRGALVDAIDDDAAAADFAFSKLLDAYLDNSLCVTCEQPIEAPDMMRASLFFTTPRRLAHEGVCSITAFEKYGGTVGKFRRVV